MKPVNKIMVCLDLTETDEVILRYATFICDLLQNVEKILFVHIIKFEYPQEVEGILKDLDKPLTELIAEEIEEQSNRIFSSVRPGINRNIIIRESDSTPYALASLSKKEKIDLTVVGRKGPKKGSGIVAREMLRLGDFESSMLMVPDSAPHRIDHILVPVDFSENAGKAIRLALHLAEVTDAKVSCQHVYGVPAHYFPYIPVKGLLRPMEKEARKEYEKFVNSLRIPEAKNIPCEFTASGDKSVSERVRQYAEDQETDLILIGSRGRTGLATYFIGSVATQLVVSDWNIPLLIVREIQ